MKKTGHFLTALIWSVILFPAVSPAGKENLVGKKVVGDMKIELYMEHSKKGMVMTSGKKMAMMGQEPTYHQELEVVDVKSGQLVKSRLRKL